MDVINNKLIFKMTEPPLPKYPERLERIIRSKEKWPKEDK